MQEKESKEFLAHLKGPKGKNGEWNEGESMKEPFKLQNKHRVAKIEYYRRKGGWEEKPISSESSNTPTR